jgi:hypothetical protein
MLLFRNGEMRVGNRSSKFIAAGFLICVTLRSGIAQGQTPDPSAVNEAVTAAPSSRRELFEHEWAWIEPPERPRIKRVLLHRMGPRLQDPDPAPIGDLVGVATISAPRYELKIAVNANSAAGYYGTSIPLLPVLYPLPCPEPPQFPRGDLPVKSTAVRGGEVTWDSLQREWRTPPLWGVRDTAPYLHEGRAATLEEAILWHGREADSSRHAFCDLSRGDQDLLPAFLASLRAPE